MTVLVCVATIARMQWLLHGSLTVAVADSLRRRGDGVHELAELELSPGAAVADVLKAAQARQWDVLTGDEGLANAPFATDYWFDRSIVYLQLEGGEEEQDDALDRLFARYRRLTPKRLYTVTASRVKVRQLPGRTG